MAKRSMGEISRSWMGGTMSTPMRRGAIVIVGCGGIVWVVGGARVQWEEDGGVNGE